MYLYILVYKLIEKELSTLKSYKYFNVMASFSKLCDRFPGLFFFRVF